MAKGGFNIHITVVFIYPQAGEQGLLGVDTPEEVGGLGGDFLMSCIVSEEMSYNGCSALGWPVHSDIVMPYISKYGSDEQKALLPSMVSILNKIQ